MSSAAAEPALARQPGGQPADGPRVLVACLKFVDRRPEVDPLTGAVRTDARSTGASAADEAALEWALRLGAAWGLPVLALSAGGPGAEAMLREALAAGATSATRVAADASAPSRLVAAAVASALRPLRPLVVCGAWSLDRGSGAFPSFLAAELGCAQALGLVGLEPDPEVPFGIRAVRRLDGGRREHLACAMPAVVSVEASTARLRRASLDGVLAARRAHIEVAAAPPSAPPPNHMSVAAFRPRARVLAPPTSPSARGRVLELTGAANNRPAARVVTLEPGPAAEAIVEQLRAWGYLP